MVTLKSGKLSCHGFKLFVGVRTEHGLCPSVVFGIRLGSLGNESKGMECSHSEGGGIISEVRCKVICKFRMETR